MTVKQPHCPDCKSLTVMYRAGSNSFICRRCGCVFARKPRKAVTK
jgi:ribosomal protein L37AE/L43A